MGKKENNVIFYITNKAFIKYISSLHKKSRCRTIKKRKMKALKPYKKFISTEEMVSIKKSIEIDRDILSLFSE